MWILNNHFEYNKRTHYCNSVCICLNKNQTKYVSTNNVLIMYYSLIYLYNYNLDVSTRYSNHVARVPAASPWQVNNQAVRQLSSVISPSSLLTQSIFHTEPTPQVTSGHKTAACTLADSSPPPNGRGPIFYAPNAIFSHFFSSLAIYFKHNFNRNMAKTR